MPSSSKRNKGKSQTHTHTHTRTVPTKKLAQSRKGKRKIPTFGKNYNHIYLFHQEVVLERFQELQELLVIEINPFNWITLSPMMFDAVQHFSSEVIILIK